MISSLLFQKQILVKNKEITFNKKQKVDYITSSTERIGQFKAACLTLYKSEESHDPMKTVLCRCFSGLLTFFYFLMLLQCLVSTVKISRKENLICIEY